MYFAPKVQETTVSMSGTGTITCAGATAGHASWGAFAKVGDPVPYALIDVNGLQFEEGIGTLVSVSPSVISRDTVMNTYSSGTAGYGTAIALSTGSHTIQLSQTAGDANKRIVQADMFVDYVASGLTVPTASGSLTASVAAGVAYVVGQRVVKGAQSRTYTASKDTYVDLKYDGTLTYVEVANGAAAPSITPNSIRLGFVTSGASTITSGTDLRNLYRLPTCILQNASPGALGVNSFVAVPYASAANTLVDNTGMHSATTNPSRVTISTPGIYLATTFVSFTSAVSSAAYSGLAKNGGTMTGPNGWAAPSSGGSYTAGFSKAVAMKAGDYLEHYVYLQSATSAQYDFTVSQIG